MEANSDSDDEDRLHIVEEENALDDGAMLDEETPGQPGDHEAGWDGELGCFIILFYSDIAPFPALLALNCIGCNGLHLEDASIQSGINKQG